MKMNKMKTRSRKVPNSQRDNSILATSSVSRGKQTHRSWSRQQRCRKHRASQSKFRRKGLLLTLMLKNSSLQICLSESTNPKKNQRSVRSPHPDSPRNKRSKPKMNHTKIKLILLKIKLNSLKC